MERPQNKLETADSAPNRRLLKKQTLGQLDDETVTRQARHSRQCPEKELLKKKNIESTIQWNGHKKS